MERVSFRVEREMKLEDFLMKELCISRTTVRRLKHSDGLLRNGNVIRTVDRVFPDDEVVLAFPDEEALVPNKALCVDIAYEDSSAVVFDKPVSMPVHPSAKHREDTLGNYFSCLYPNRAFRPINRLDRDTSGLCAVALDPVTAQRLQGSIEKTYYAVVCGVIEGEGTVDLPIARETGSVIKRTVREDGRRAVTHYKALVHNDRYTLLKIRLETGRTHQIRVHFSHLGHPLAGDDLYGGSTADTAVQALHCGEMSFISGYDGKRVTVCSELREDMKRLICGSTA